MAKRTGLGRGIGALIPTGTEVRERPADVFFAGSAAPIAEDDAPSAPAKKAPARKAPAKKTTPARSTTPTAKKASGSTASSPEKKAEETAPKAPARTPATRKAAPAKAAPAQAAETPSEPAQATEELAEVPGIRLVSLDPHKILPNPRQPRTLFDADDLAELVHSVKEFGVLQPVVVRDKKDGTFELIMGERRTRASREAGLAEIPAIVRETADEDLLRDALLENIHRAELNVLEEASAYQQLINDFGITQEQLADRIGRSRPQISNTIRLLRLPEPVQQRVAAGVLSAGHARTILSLDGDAEGMQRLADKIVNEELTVRGAEAAAKQIAAAGEGASKPAAKPKAGARRAYLDEVSDKLGDRLDTKVKIDLTARKGQIKISFATIQDLNRILSELGEEGYEQ
ncbi:ParB/RepB/Spo0J family partition protein [Microbacterium sp. G2-8]|uniref:ParB/RepB/Spo0J family partition protein n=1 Tax=Microbacterium sp. G2-8 TaxID=2842454 RepID=UPI0021A986E2|nr:ParB/RepB/Spo0J family partition protein [Microbacterium sp. G2-8]